MKVTFLGTGAADWDIACYERGKEFRRFSSALINDDLLIDPGPHIFHFAAESGNIHLFDNVKNIIVTHTHEDHFCRETVGKLCVGKDVILWGDSACIRKLGGENIKFRETVVGRKYEIGGYEVTPLRANHSTGDPLEVPRVYLVGQNDRLLYYGCDCSWIPTDTWNAMKNDKINVLVLENTCGELAHDDWRSFEHNTFEMLELMLKMFGKYGYFADDVRYFTSHMARTLHTDHETLIKRLAPLGVIPAFDGMTVEI